MTGSSQGVDVAAYAIQQQIIRAAPAIVAALRRGFDVELRLSASGQLVVMETRKKRIPLEGL